MEHTKLLTQASEVVQYTPRIKSETKVFYFSKMIHIQPNDFCSANESREKVAPQPEQQQQFKKKPKQKEPKKLFADNKAISCSCAASNNEEPTVSRTSRDTHTFVRRKSLSDPGLLTLLPPPPVENDEQFLEGLIFFAPSCEKNIRDIYGRGGGSLRNIKQGK
jgi:hypothetical protein